MISSFYNGEVFTDMKASAQETGCPEVVHFTSSHALFLSRKPMSRILQLVAIFPIPASVVSCASERSTMHPRQPMPVLVRDVGAN
jgi:hypothetical protein